ncbi:MAG: hypothetical protein V3V17_12160, partial [Alphaproteobacteria bacterium]
MNVVMRRPCHVLALIHLAMVVSFAAMNSAQACSCITPTPEEHVSRTEVIFRGTVIEMFEGGPSSDSSAISWAYTAAFEVEHVWKGSSETRLMVSLRSTQDAACGVTFKTGWLGIVFAYWAQDGTLSTNLCMLRPYHGYPEIRAAYDVLLPGHEMDEERRARLEKERT